MQAMLEKEVAKNLQYSLAIHMQLCYTFIYHQ